MLIKGQSTYDMTTELVHRERRLRNLSNEVGTGLDEEIKRNKSALSKRLNQDFNKEITIAETCVYHDDFDGSLYHGLVANMINRTLKELEV